MRCPICRSGETKPGTAAFQHTHGQQLVVIRNVPAEICSQCGEVYYDEELLDELMQLVQRALSAGLEVAISDFQPPVAA